MKKFEVPTMDVEKLDVVDVITTSNECPDHVPPCGNDMGEW